MLIPDSDEAATTTPETSVFTDDSFDNGSKATRSSSDGRKNFAEPREGGSSLRGAVFNFTNSIVGAGAIGLGGAFASSGGIVSIACVLLFAWLSKLSLDMLIRLAVETGTSPATSPSYESLGKAAFGRTGRISVMLLKSLYSFGTLLVYIIVVKENLGFGLVNVIYGNEIKSGSLGVRDDVSWFHKTLLNEDLLTWLVSAFVILPICLLRDLAPLAKFSFVSIVAMVMIVLIIVHLYFSNPGGTLRLHDDGFVQNWLSIRGGIFQSLGTFVFTFVSHHNVHMAYDSIDPSVRSLESWKTVSSASIGIASIVSLSIGMFTYMTFWQHTLSDIFQVYPSCALIDAARILLSVTMVLSFPMPFFTCREMIIVALTDFSRCFASRKSTSDVEMQETNDNRIIFVKEELEEPLMRLERDLESISDDDLRLETDISHHFLLEGSERQCVLSYHIILTFTLWLITTFLAIVAPSLGDVLDFVGSFAGTSISFILPSLFSFKLMGYTREAAAVFVVGGAVGSIGTFFSLMKLLKDS